MSASLGFNCIKEYSLLKARIAPTCKPRWDCVDKQACYYIHMLHPCMGVSDMVFQFQYEEVVSREGGKAQGLWQLLFYQCSC